MMCKYFMRYSNTPPPPPQNIYVSGASQSVNQQGRQISIPREWMWGKITGVLSCSVSDNPSSLTDTAATCCTSVGQPTAPHVAYTYIEVEPDSCGRWKEMTRTGVAYEFNDSDVSLNAIVRLYEGFADDKRFSYGGVGSGSGTSGTDIPYRCEEVLYAASCERDEDGNETGVTLLHYKTIAVLDYDCTSTSGVL